MVNSHLINMEKSKCVSNGMSYTSNPVQYKCINCGNFWFPKNGTPDCHKPSVEVSKCDCDEKGETYLMKDGEKHFKDCPKFEPQSIPLDRDGSEEKKCSCGCHRHWCSHLDCIQCGKKDNKTCGKTTPNLTPDSTKITKDNWEAHYPIPESTEMEEWEKELVSILPLQHATLEVHNILFKFINKTLNSHSQKLIEHCDTDDCPECQTKLLDKYKAELKEKIEKLDYKYEGVEFGSSKTLDRDEVLEIINNS